MDEKGPGKELSSRTPEDKLASEVIDPENPYKHGNYVGWGYTENALYKEFGVLPNDCPIQRSLTMNETTNVNFREAERATVTATDVMELPKARFLAEGGTVKVTAYIVSSHLGIWKERRAFQSSDDGHRPDAECDTLAPDKTIVPFTPRPPEELDFEGWGPADEIRLGLKKHPPQEQGADDRHGANLPELDWRKESKSVICWNCENEIPEQSNFCSK